MDGSCDDRLVAFGNSITNVRNAATVPQVRNEYGQGQFDEQLFNLLCNENEQVPVSRLIKAIRTAGLWRNDPRLSGTMSRLQDYMRTGPISSHQQQDRVPNLASSDAYLDRDSFRDCVRHSATLIRRAFTGDLVVPEFQEFCHQIDDIYLGCRNVTDGHVADYIPQLARYSPDYWGVSLCTIDGQRHSIGDVEVPFTIQSGGKPSNYAIAVNELGSEKVHEFVGHEPSGESFNCIKLSPENKPHNPLINAGAIVVTSLIKQKWNQSDRFDHMLSQYRRLVGGEYLGFNNAVFLSEKETAHRNFALGHYMMENHCFPQDTVLEETLEFYFQLCSIEVNVNSAAIMAATFANGGFCPITGEEILSSTSVRNTLSLMHSCGMYDYSGGFAFRVGLPAKSAVSGMILLVIPNVMGMCLWSPPLEKMGNSVRGVAFAEQLVREFNFHHYDNIKHTASQKCDPRIRKADSQASGIVNLLFGAYNGDLTALRLMALANNDMAASDYDGRTALHLATSEGHLDCVHFLVEKCNVNVLAADRWGHTALDDAVRFNRTAVKIYLEKVMEDFRDQPAGELPMKQSSV